MNRFEILHYYSNPEIIEQIIRISENREVVGKFLNGGFDKRPNIIQFPSDIIQMVKNGITSFHISVERWKNPMQLSSESGYDELRIGFDVVMDMDSKIGIDASQIAALLVCNLLEDYGIKNYGIKFSGSRGFHIIIPWEAFPKEVDYKPLAKRYPEVLRAIAEFIRERISDNLMKNLIKLKGAKELIEILEEPPEMLDPFYFVDLEKDWGNRHMFRAPYSLNEKTWLVSIPLSKNELEKFNTEMAKPGKVKIKEFIKVAEKDEAANLLLDALDFVAKQKKSTKKVKRKIVFTKRVPENLFPPCMKNVLKGLSDGRKRSLFTLTNFLRLMNWTQDEIREKILEWNLKNRGPLPSSIINASLRWNLNNPRTTPNCEGDGRKHNSLYYGFVCEPDEICKKIRNPVSYPFRLMPKKKIIQKNVYKCEVCNKGFKSMRSLNIHRSRVHGII